MEMFSHLLASTFGVAALSSVTLAVVGLSVDAYVNRTSNEKR